MKTTKNILAIIITFLSFNFQLFAQNVVEGTVNDVKTHTVLPFANVYVDGTTIGTQTDEKGQFSFSNLPTGPIKLVISYLGYETFHLDISIDPLKPIKTTINLTPIENVLSDVEVKAKRDKVWERTLKRFQEQFFGDSPNRSKCTILNAWAIDFENDEKNGALVATASRPIEIENRALGYKLFFDLKSFSISKSQIRLLGTNRFEELKPADEKEKKRWLSNRELTFNRSSRHFFRKLVTNQFDQSGYIIYKMDQNSDWWGTNVWDKDKSFYKPNNAISDNSQLFQLSINEHEKLLAAPNIFEVIHDKVYVTVPSQNVFEKHPVTRIKVIKPVVITDKGYLNNASAIEMIGYWASERIADMLPNDYLPENPEAAPKITKTKTPIQQVYVQTNKPSYATGEQIWFSAFVTEDTHHQLTSEPQPLYVQLFKPSGESTSEAVIFTQNGRGNGYLQILDTLSSGPYRLRAFTKAMRNTPPLIFEKEISILNPQQKTGVWWIANNKTSISEDTISMALNTSKTVFGPLEKVTVNLKSLLANNPAKTSLVVSVYDADRVIKNPQTLNISSYFTDKIAPQAAANTFQKEQALNFIGRAMNEKNRTFLGKHTVLFTFIDSVKTQTKLIETDENGRFELPNVDLDGVNMLVYQISNSKGKVVNDGEVLFEPLFPTAKLPVQKFEKIPLSEMTKSSEIAWEGRQIEGNVDGLNLQEVVISKKQDIKTDPNDVGIIKLHSEANYAINFDEKVPFTDIYNMIMQLPGVQIITDGSGVYGIRIRGIGTINNNEPMIVLDGMVMAASSNLNSLVSPLHVRRIEVLSGANATMYGMGAGNGVIAIYTRRFKEKYNPNSDAKTIMIEGYQKAETFPNPDFEKNPSQKSKERITLYWNPDIQTDTNGEATFSFFTSSRPANYKIVVEGMTSSGKVGHSEKIISVK